MKKMIIVYVLLPISLFGFRVTKDHGNGIKTYEDSEGNRKFSFDGGNTWYNTRTSSETSSRISYFDIEKSLKDKFLDSIDYEKDDIVIVAVKSGMAKTSSGKKKNISGFRLQAGKSGVDYFNPQLYIYLKSLDPISKFLKYREPGSRFNDFEYYEIYSKISCYRLTEKLFCDIRMCSKLVKLKSGYLISIEDFIHAYLMMKYKEKKEEEKKLPSLDSF